MPSLPGVYVFANQEKYPLYIGKSINLRSRAKQHLELSKSSSSKAKNYISRSSFFQYKITQNDLEAIILESYLIKTTKPYYNTLSKDDKSYSYITITNPPFSKISITHSSDLKLNTFDNPKTQVFGPFLSVRNAKFLLKTIRFIFGFCQHPYNSNQKPCFYYHLHQCPGPCTGKFTPKEYIQHLVKVKRFLSGNFSKLKKDLARKIISEAKTKNFESAQYYKNQLDKLEKSLLTPTLSGFLNLPSSNQKTLETIMQILKPDHLNSLPSRIECYDIAHLQQHQTVGSMVVLKNGQPNPSLYRHFIINYPKKGDPHSLKEIIIRRLSHPDWPRPDLILIDGGIPQLSIVNKIISNIPVIAISKKHETLHFYRNQKLINLNLSPHHPILKMLQTARDEAHRFATTFHQKKRRLAILNST